MTRTCIIKFFILLCAISISANGQSRSTEELEKIIRENVKLKSEIDTLRNDSSSYERIILDLNEELHRLQTQIEELNSKKDTLANAMSKDSIAATRKSINRLRETLHARNDSLATLKEMYRELQIKVKDAKSSVNNMQAFSAELTKEKYKLNKQLLQQRYSLISNEALEELHKGQTSFKDCADYKDYVNRIQAAIRNKEVFERGKELICSPFNWSEIVETRKKTIALLELKADQPAKGVYKLTNDQFHEIDTLDISLSRYKDGIINLQKVIKAINQNPAVASYRKKNNQAEAAACHSKIMSLLPQKGSNIYNRYYSMIPYLEKLLNDYKSEIAKKPLANTETEEIINNIEITR